MRPALLSLLLLPILAFGARGEEIRNLRCLSTTTGNRSLS